MRSTGSSSRRFAVVLSLLLCTVLPLGCGVEAPTGQLLQVGQRAFYALRLGERVIGYTSYRVSGRERQGGRDLFTVDSNTFLQVDVAGQTQRVYYCATSVLAADYAPQRYELSIAHSGGALERVSAVRGPSGWQLAVEEAGQRQEGQLPLAEATYLLDNNLFEQCAFLAAALRLKPGETRAVRVLVPQMLAGLALELSASAEEQEISVGGAPQRCRRVTVTGEQVSTTILWLAPSGEMVRLEIPAQNLALERSDESVVGQVQSVELAAFMEGKSTPANVEFSAFWNVDRLVAQLEVKVVGERVDPAFLSDARQTFAGTVEDGWVRGRVETRRLRYALDRAPRFPVHPSTDPELARYLHPEEGVESDDPAIVAKAQELAKGTATTWQAAQAIADWVHRNIAYEVTAGGARACLGTRQGDCGPQTRLVMAMCRALGIPARMVGGLMYSGGRFGQHYWAEVYLGEAGWVPLDAMAGEFADLDATHIRLWQVGTVEALNIEVLDYMDRGLGAGPLPRRAPSLQSGERYTYAFVWQGKPAGTLTWRVIGPEVLDGAESWHLQAGLSLNAPEATPGGAQLLTLADLWVDANGRPQLYRARTSLGEEAPVLEARFAATTVHEQVSAHGQEVTKDVPLPAEVFLMANNMVGWRALIYRCLRLEEGQSLVVPVFVTEGVAVQAIHLNVQSGHEAITVGGRQYECLAVEVPEFDETDYVTPEGLLVRIILPAQETAVDLQPEP